MSGFKRVQLGAPPGWESLMLGSRRASAQVRFFLHCKHLYHFEPPLEGLGDTPEPLHITLSKAFYRL